MLFEFNVIYSLPYAHVETLFGAQGNAGTEYALRRRSGRWQILGSNGSKMPESTLVALGVPRSNADAMFNENVYCTPEPRSTSGPNALQRGAVAISRVQAATVRLVEKREHSALKFKVVRMFYRGRMQTVTIYQALTMRVCNTVLRVSRRRRRRDGRFSGKLANAIVRPVGFVDTAIRVPFRRRAAREIQRGHNLGRGR